MSTRLSRCGGSSGGLRGMRDQIVGWPSVTRPSGPVCGEEKATSEVVSVLRTQRAWWISPPKHDEHAHPGGLLAGGDADRVDEVRRAVGARAPRPAGSRR